MPAMPAPDLPDLPGWDVNIGRWQKKPLAEGRHPLARKSPRPPQAQGVKKPCRSLRRHLGTHSAGEVHLAQTPYSTNTPSTAPKPSGYSSKLLLNTLKTPYTQTFAFTMYIHCLQICNGVLIYRTKSTFA